MKKTAWISCALLVFFAADAVAQEPEKKEEAYAAWKNATVDSITSKYNYGTKTAAALTPEKIFPVIGTYDVNEAAQQSVNRVSITIDEQNKGLAWIEGLPQGKIKAFLKKSPATYKIPAQKTEEGKDVAEGTLMYDKETNSLSICIGKAYNDAEPGAAFMTETAPLMEKAVAGKKQKPTKAKVLQYTGKKVEETAVASGN